MARNKISSLERKARYEISQNLKRLTHGMTQKELSEKTGIPASTLSGYFAQRSTPNAGALQKIADVLGVNKSDIDPRYNYLSVAPNEALGDFPSNAEYLYNSDSHAVRIPIIGSIAMGSPITAEQNVEGYTTEIFSTLPSGALFALRCKGHSMEPTIPNGALAIIRQQSDVEDNEIAAVQVNNDCEATLKRVQHQGKQIILMPDNKDYKPIILSKNYPGRIVGKLIRYSVDLDNPRQD